MPRSLRPLLSAALLVASARPSLAQQAAPVAVRPADRAALAGRLDSIASDYLREAPAAGMTIAVVSRGDTLLLKGYGERDREKHLPAEASTVYRVGSITKQFTAAAVMRLVERGAVRLDDPVTKHLPQYPQWKDVTVRQLLNHTSGIKSYTSSPEWRKHWGETLTPAALIAFVEKDTFDFRPGTAFRYNNTGYMLLGLLIEKVTKQPYAAHVQRELFAPLGMRSATYCPSAPAGAAYALAYSRADEAFKPAEPLDMSHPYAAGALCMSVPDFLKWQAALMSGRVVKPASLALMTGPETLLGGGRTGYGMGLAPGAVGSHKTVQHGGAINGFSTQQFWFPAERLSVVAFVNTDGADPDRVVNNLASAVLGLPLNPMKLTAVPLAAAEREKFAGDYDLSLPDGRIMPFRIFVEGEELMGQAEGQGKAPLKYIGNDTFGADFDPTVRFIFAVKDGKVESAKLHQRGAVMNVTRRP
jgi:CubicO group peptidase (beta-lactamase class C family)